MRANAPTDILNAAGFLRSLNCENERTRLKCHAHAASIERAATIFETLLLLESTMRDLNTLIPIVVADVTKLRADNAALTTANADLTAKLAASTAATATPENLQALDQLEPDPNTGQVQPVVDGTVQPDKQA